MKPMKQLEEMEEILIEKLKIKTKNYGYDEEDRRLVWK